MSVQRKSTEKMELVETHNIALSIMRIREKPSWSDSAWKRSLYHAMQIAEVGETTCKAVREALQLP